ncbi:MAG: 1-deoxy-D-xylulose-5-phosphate synthase [Planctomycetota bacterium]|jgi:1-deoxy-D-xylulose-5-phosphate synthase
MTEEKTLLESIRSPEDIRQLQSSELVKVAGEIRRKLIDVVSVNGGHLASNLGVVELTLALHKVFDFEKDYLVFDVGHQCYVHKILTGRLESFHTLRQKDGITGFPNPAESNQDPFVSGHAATSISNALGLAIASRLNDSDSQPVAVIGDGSIGGGLSFEALNHAGHIDENMLVILNDNDMAIAETVGALSGYLTKIRTEPIYQKAREEFTHVLKKIPFIGSQLDWLLEAIVDALKQVVEPGHIFSDLGFSYYGPIDGHNIDLLVEELENIKRLHGPKLLHVITKKGNGFDAAVTDPEKYHSASPFEVLPGGRVVGKGEKKPAYTASFSEALLKCCEKDKDIVAITAAMPAGTGLGAIAEKFPERYIDVGISEEHAVTMAGGLARGGKKPVVVIYSTFIQRGYDEIFHDVCLQPDLGVVFGLDRGGLVGSDGPTHHGVFDIAMLRNLPNLVLMAPRDGGELANMLEFALTLGKPVAFRYPRSNLPEPVSSDYAALELGRSEVLREGADGVVFAYGEMVNSSFAACQACAEEGVELTLVNLRFAKPVDEECILKYAGQGVPLFTVEDGTVCGGVGSAVAEVILDNEIKGAELKRIGIPDRFIEHATRSELLAMLGLDAEGLQKTFLNVCRKKNCLSGQSK